GGMLLLRCGGGWRCCGGEVRKCWCGSAGSDVVGLFVSGGLLPSR
ncbi:hypothetical protein A2U01_0051590, partial [Trifolium medium]|nr:hypothetical protein [Trifolium medium]